MRVYQYTATLSITAEHEAAADELADMRGWDPCGGEVPLPRGVVTPADLFAAGVDVVAGVNPELPTVVITIEGGTFQGAMASERMGIELFDVDNLKAEGKDEAERDAFWNELTAGMVPVA